MERRMRGFGRAALAVAACAALAAPVAAQTWQRGNEGWCEREGWGGDRDERFCEVLTTSVASSGRLDVDGGMNGGVEVTGWNGSDIQIEARVWTRARSIDRARELSRDVAIRVESGTVRADGPDTERRESWGVSYRIRVPYGTDLDVRTHNGGVDITDVEGRIRFQALNGGVHLNGLAGDVQGRTTNGGLSVALGGDRWSGAGLDVETTNGGVKLYVPEGYSAHLVTGTVNGGFDIDFPIMLQGRIGRRLETSLGEGGTTIRAVTTNGGVHLERGTGVERR